MEEGSVDDSTTSTTVVTTIEMQIIALILVSIELTTKDLQQWTKAYKDDKGHVTTYMELCKGQKYQDFYLTPLGLMARLMGDRQKIIVPKSLWQQILM